MMDGDYSASVPSVAKRVAAAQAERARLGAWDVPVEMALTCSSSIFKSVIWARYGRGEHPLPTAKVIVRDDRFYATIFFPGYADLFLPLDCWTMENGR